MTILLFVILVVLVILIVVSTVMYFIQDKIIFHAEKLPKDYIFSFNSDFEEINLKTQDGNLLNGLLFKSNNTKKLVLFYHNHSGNIEHWSRSALFFNKLDHDVLLMDYRGFGKSTGKFNEKNFINDSLMWYDHALEKYEERYISVYGRGLGAFFATYVSSVNQPKQLILESPIYSFAYLGKFHYPYLPYRILSNYKFDTAKYITNVNCSIYIFHGKKNKLVNYKNSIKLHRLSEDKIELFLIPDGNHYNLINNKLFLNKLEEIYRK